MGTWDPETGSACAGVLAELLTSPQAGGLPTSHSLPSEVEIRTWRLGGGAEGVRCEQACQQHSWGVAPAKASLRLREEQGSVSPGGRFRDALGNTVDRHLL